MFPGENLSDLNTRGSKVPIYIQISGKQIISMVTLKVTVEIRT